MEVDASDSERPGHRKLRAVACAAIVLASVAWLPLAAGVIWPGTAVLERCDQAAADSYGKESAYAVRGEQHVRWWTPGWHCPLDNGESVTVSAWP